ncbi:MAG: FAD-dependent oxidoreductase [Ignavibacteriales bacterium]|nr:FAD-dependent oxidoreductase [Ignavibacteriales bacterium]
MKRRIVIIGGVAAGPSAAAKAKRINPDADVILYESGEHVSYGVCEIPYYISGEVTDAKKLEIFSPERLQKEKGVTVRTLNLVEEIVPSKREVKIKNLSSGSSVIDYYDKLIIATGNNSKKLNIEGENARNVFHVKTLAGAHLLFKYIKEENPRSATIIGAGFIGLEMADALQKRGMDVTVVHRSSAPLSVASIEAQKEIITELASNSIDFIPDAKVEWLGIGAKQNVVAVGLKDRTIDTDLVIIAVGVEPNSLLAKNSGIHIGKYGGVLTGERMNTLGADNIFAAGDCCELKNIVTKKPFYLSLATTASKTGWVAGENAAGGTAQFKGTIRAIGLRICNLEVAQAGLTHREATDAGFDVVSSTIVTNSRIGFMPGNAQLTITTLADKKTGKLLGACTVGKDGAAHRANVFSVAIRHGLTAHDLSELDLVYAPPFAPLWDGVVMSGIQLDKLL